MRKYHLRKSNQDPLYKYEPWQIIEEDFKIENNHHNETIFALGNGYMGLRGTLEEDYSGPLETTTPGVYINGVYGSEEIFYGEEIPALPKKRQTILNLADWTEINLYLDGERFDILTGRICNYQRRLNMKGGILKRELIWTSPNGKKIQLKTWRCLSLTAQHNGLIYYSFTPLNFNGKVVLSSAIKGDVYNYHYLRNKKALRMIDKGFIKNKGYILQEAVSTGIFIGTAMSNHLSLSSATKVKELQFIEVDKLIDQFEIKVTRGEDYILTKYAYLANSRDREKTKLKNQILMGVEKAVEKGWQDFLIKQREFMDNYWDDIDIKIYGDSALQQAFRFNAFHLLQSTGRNGKTNVAGKGLTGEFYEGHYFWDTETYILPFFLYSKPKIAKELLIYRYNKLDQARDNAWRMKLKGALYPWRTINGKEASGFFMGSTVQYHINADIAFAIYQYFNATADDEFLFAYGAEILIETARMWLSLGSYISLKGDRFCLNEVCGPDEYKPGVNNNCYTNYMAKFNFEFAFKVIKLMEDKIPIRLKKLKLKLNLQDSELEKWKEAAQKMYLPYNEELKIQPQDDSFLYKEPIEIDSIPEKEIPLVRNWHPLIIWRYQLIKQADVILLMLLQGDKFSLEEKKANYDYYEPKTTHDSSLSPAIYSIIANEIGYHNEAYNYFLQTVRLDLDDYNNNTYQGIHMACMASSWLALIQGFAGMRTYNSKLNFNPYLPEKWEGYEFKIKFQGCQLKVKVDARETSYELLKGKKLTIIHKGKEIRLSNSRIN